MSHWSYATPPCPTPGQLLVARPCIKAASPRDAERRRRGFTLVELLVVIAIIGILVALLLPAIQAAREAARRSQCQQHLSQLVIAVHNYQMTHGVYPMGTQERQGPIQNHAVGYHHSWITQILPYMEEKNAFEHIDWKVGVYHKNNAPVRRLGINILSCPSSNGTGRGFTSYAAVHHDVEAPIDANNNGVFFLNSRLTYDDISDGSSHTLFIGEKIIEPNDLGWMSGTRWTLRNTGTPINTTGKTSAGNAGWGYGGAWNWRSSDYGQQDPFAKDTDEYGYGMDDPYGGVYEEEDDQYGDESSLGGEFRDDGEIERDANEMSETVDTAEDTAEDEEIVEETVEEIQLEGSAAETEASDAGGESEDSAEGEEQRDDAAGPVLPVGGFASPHPGGTMFAFGDGHVEFLSESIGMNVYKQLGSRADGQLIDSEEY